MSEHGMAAGQWRQSGQGHTSHDLELPGCTPEPLMAYLKALGILRLVSEQADSNARAWWRTDTFWLRSTLDGEALVRFFLEKYQPTPIVAPWAGGSGFFKKDNKTAVDTLRKSIAARVKAYSDVIERVHAIIDAENIGDKPQDEDKVRLIRRYRRELPDALVVWIDAAMVLEPDGQSFAPLLGTGGNDGRLDFTQNFMRRIVTLGLHIDGPPSDESRSWLGAALFASAARLDSASVGQFAPGRAGGPNATQGMEGASTDNPWDFVLMLEGALLLAGAASKRLGAVASGRAAFPFTVRAIAAGYNSPASDDEAASRGELWLPVWTSAASMGELRQLFGEGRADVSGRPVRDGADFARAVATLGVDRGIAEFRRVAFLKRSGKAYLAAPIGRFEVRERWEAELLREIDPWLNRLRSACSSNAPARFARALRAIDSAVFDFCRYGGRLSFENIIIALGRAERDLALTPGKVGQSKWPPGPLAGLSRDWLAAAAADQSPGGDTTAGAQECAISRALAGINDVDHKIGSLRTNLEPVREWYDSEELRRKAIWAEEDRAVVWTATDLPTNLAAILARRMIDADRKGCERLPLWSSATASLSSVADFIAGDLDDRRIEDLLWGLMLVEPNAHHPPESDDSSEIPATYALLRLLFLPRPLVIERRVDKGVSARYATQGENGVRIRPEPRILHLLRAGRLGEACVIAMRRLRASGLAPMPRARAGRTRDGDWRELDRVGAAGLDPVRLAAALLIPISEKAVSRLVTRITRPEDIKTPEPAGSLVAGD